MRTSILLFLSMLLLTPAIFAQEKKIFSQGRAAETFPYPYEHFTFIQPRFDRTNYEDGYYNAYVIRGVKAFKNQFHLRVEVPFANDPNVFGLSDVKVRLLHATPIQPKLYLAYGAELVFPTATDPALGEGKWQVHPALGAIYFFGEPNHVTGTVSLGVDYRFDYAGPSDREHVRVLGIAPNFDYWGARWYIGYYATWSYNFRTDYFDLPLDIEIGYTVLPQITLAVEFIQPLLKDAPYKNEFAIKLRYSFPNK